MKTLTLTHVCGKTVVNAVYPKVFEFVKLWNCHCDPAGCGGGNLPDIYKGLLQRQIASSRQVGIRNDGKNNRLLRQYSDYRRDPSSQWRLFLCRSYGTMANFFVFGPYWKFCHDFWLTHQRRKFAPTSRPKIAPKQLCLSSFATPTGWNPWLPRCRSAGALFTVH